jgi:hypothetical protein
MKPVFFPFTFMTESVLETCNRFFKEIVVLQPTGDNIPKQMKVWQTEGLLDIQAPKSDEENIAAVLRDYRTWAQYHQGGDISVYRYVKDTIPFFDDASISQIKKDIRTTETGKSKDSASAAKDLLFQARLFLQMAQEFDEQNLDIARNLKDQEEMERGVFEGLRGGEAVLPMSEKTEPSSLPDDPFGYMLSDRLSAWARVILSYGMPGDFFITNSRESIESAVDGYLKTEARVHMQKIPGFPGDADVMVGLQEAFIGYLKKVSQISPFQENSVPQFSVENGDEGLAMELYVIPGISPPDFLSRFLKKEVTVPAVTNNRLSIKNTILGLILKKN